jgi:plastocyanin
MPPWLTDNGGALNFFQIQQLVTLILSDFSLEGWEYAVEQANHGDTFIPARRLASAVSATDTTIHVDSVAGMKASTQDSPVSIRLGGENMEAEYEILLVVAINESANTLDVERGADVAGTKAIEHAEGAEVFQGPIAPGTTITGNPDAQGFPPCGQKAAAAQASPTPAAPGAAIALADGQTISIGDNFFDVSGQHNPAFTIAAGASVTIKLSNGGAALHNLRIAGPDGKFNTDDDIVSDPDKMAGSGEGNIAISIAAAGTYNYQCDFHPADMKGTIAVQ